MGNTNEASQLNIWKAVKPWQPSKELYILMVGPIGAGKSTLINSLWLWQQITMAAPDGEDPYPDHLTNPTVAVPAPACSVENCECAGTRYPTDPMWETKSSEIDFTDLTKSQTSTPNHYTFDLQLPDRYKGYSDIVEEKGAKVTVHILDTPGFGHTRSTEDPLIEQRNINQILQYIVQQKVPKLDCLLYLFNGSVPRSTAFEKVIQSLSQIFPRTFENFRCLATNTGTAGGNLDPTHLFQFRSETITMDKVYSYDNCLFKHYYPKLASKPTVSQRGRGRPQYNIHKFYRDTWDEEYYKITDTLGNLFYDISKQEPARTDQFGAIFQENAKLAATMSEIVAKILMVNVKQVQTPYKNTLCTIPGCYSNCHENCKREVKHIGDECLKKCSCFQNGACSKCQHSYTQHMHFNYKWVIETTQQSLDSLADLKTQHKASFRELSKLTYVSDFDLYIRRQIGDWIDLRNATKSGPRVAQISALIEELLSMMSEQGRKDLNSELWKQRH